ncbi:MAG: hypothetical protein H7X99_01725 [Saprospiraceae bacterium]|nr:hypothetical protein [Saprospiraceae bacterium]
MNMNYHQLIPFTFDNKSRVWVYQSNRIFTLPEALEIEDLLKEFVSGWASHGTPVKGYANLFFGQFIMLMADETATGVSGCSTDSSVRLMKDLEQLFNVHLFDRHALAFIIKERVQVIPMAQLKYAIDHHFINADTLYFNNLVQTKEEFLNKWLIPVKDSWLAKRLSLEVISRKDAK